MEENNTAPASEDKREFDLEAVYDEQIAPHMEEILRVCKEHDLPMVASFQFSTTGFCTSCIIPKGSNTRLRMALQMLKEGFVAYMVTHRT